MAIRKPARTRSDRRRHRQQQLARTMFFELLERRELLTGVHAIYAPGTPPDRMLPDALDPFGDAGASALQLGGRWTSTATNGGGLQQGDPTTLTWAILPDGVSIPGSVFGDPTADSNLVAFLDGIYGAGPGGTDFTQRPWFSAMSAVFDNWSTLTGVNYVYVPYDDRANFPTLPGALNVRADVRVGGHAIDGNFGVLAYNFFPNGGDMVIDTADVFYNSTAGNSLGLRNVLGHEAGHGLGLQHVCPVDQTKLMEPFVSLAFDGPQHDDLLGVNRLYGDRLEPTDATGTAFDLGTVTTNSVSLDDVSIDGTSDTDYYKFTITSAGRANVLLRPVGQTYLEGPQISGACTAGTSFNSKTLNNLAVEILDANGVTVLAAANLQPAGVNELLTNVNLPVAGTYYIRVTGAADQVQMYGIDLSLAGSAAAGPVLIGIQPNDVGLFDIDNPFDTSIPANNTLTEAPQQLTFRFDAASPIDATTLAGIQIVRSGFDHRFDTAWATTDLATPASSAIFDFTAVKLGAGENNIRLVFNKSDLGLNRLPTVTVTGQTITVGLNSNATTPTTAQQLVDALTTDVESRQLVKTQLRAGSNAAADVTGVTNGQVVALGGAGTPVASTGLGAAFPLDLRFTALNPQANQPISLGIFKGTVPTGIPIAAPVAGAPTVYVDNQRIYVQVAGAGVTTAQQIAAAINNDPKAKLLVSATVAYGNAATDVAASMPAQTVLMLAKDVAVTPGFKGLGTTTREVITRFAETLPDDVYRIEVYGQDNAGAGQVALKNANGQLFQPTYPTLGQEITEFELKLGAQVTSVVPQPVTRTPGPGGAFAGITQARNQIDVYFNEDDLADTAASAENPAFYQLVFTADTVRNTDDAVYQPTTVSYDPLANKATLTFANDLDLLGSGAGTFRLRIGTSESPLPAPPSFTTPGSDVGSSFTSADTTSVVINPLAVTSTIVRSTISSSALVYPLDFPGDENEPGHREIPIESHFCGGVDSTGIRSIAYNFRDVYGSDPSGNTLHNQITEEQKQRAREIFDLYSRYAGVRFYETASSGITVVTGDLRALQPTIPTGPGGVAGLGSCPGSMSIMDAAESWTDEFGGSWFDVAMHEIGHNLGQGHTYDLPNAIQGSLGGVTAYSQGQEAIFPLDNDIEHLLYMYRPEVRDVDMYQFVIPAGTTGALSVETFADRSPNKVAATNGILDTSIRLYRQLPDGSRELIGQNDDYFGDDSYLNVESLGAGTYFIGVSAKGTDYDPSVANSSLGGLSEGSYDLQVNFRPAAANSIVDLEGQALDGDADGTAGGVHNFWFRAQTAANTLFVDKSAPNGGTGTTGQPFNNLQTAMTAANSGQIIRVIGNPGVDNNLATVADNQAYEIGVGPLSATLSDGPTMVVKKGVTVMVDAGAIFKVQGTRIGVGSTTTASDRSGGALQVLGTPDQVVYFTSFNDESIGVDTSPLPTTPDKGNWGGLDFREDVDRAQGRFTWDREGIFLNYVNHADIRYGGGRVQVDSVTQSVRPIDMYQARVTATHNTIQLSADAAFGATPDTFEETNFSSPRYTYAGLFTPDYSRVGPEIHGNRLSDNSYNGLFVSIETPAGNNLIPLTVAARFDDTDVVHMIADNLTVRGQAAGPYQEETAPPVNLVTLTPGAGGSMAAGSYSYRIVYIDSNGYEGVASLATSSVTVAAGGSVTLANLPTPPAASGDYVGRRLYRALGLGTYQLVAEIDKSSSTYVDRVAAGSGVLISTGTHLRPRPDARLAIDPGMVIKSEGGRIEVVDGGHLIAEGTEGRDVILTTRADDRYGGSGTFDTNNDDSAGASEIQPLAGNWGGLFIGHLSSATLDHVLITYAGGVNRVEGDFAGFNPVEIHQADVRITNSVFEDNANGTGGTAPSNRFGRGSNAAATIFVRGAQPIIANNILRNNSGAAISINANAMNEELVSDLGRQTYPAERIVDHRDNQGPFIRGNRLQGNGTNGMVVRGELLNTSSVWDDTDIVHVLTSQILVPDFHTDGGLLLHSSPTESLVVKLQGGLAGFVASGRPFNIVDRIGGTVQVVGQPGFPVILTSLRDDSVGAGFQPDGRPQTDTNNLGGTPIAGDWGSIRFDAFSNDRNVATVLERESPDVVAPGINATTSSAQYLGILAPEEKSSDENLRLGFEVHGVLSQKNDVDVYSFTGTAGTEVWLDIDRTSIPLNSVIDLLDGDGNVLATSDDSHTEKALGTIAFVSNPVTVKAYPLPKAPAAFSDQDSQGGRSKDFYTQNVYDAGLRVTLPGTDGEQGTFHVRVRSSSAATSGVYQLQIRLRELDENPGSTVQFADIRFATNAIELIGVPYHSPLLAEANEAAGDNAGPGGAQNLGNLFNSDRAALSVAGNINIQSDQDFYRFRVDYDGIQGTQEGPGSSTYIATSFDVDYSDGLARGNTSMWIFDPTGRLIAVGRDSNIADDQPGPTQGLDLDDLSRGSSGKLDPFIGPINLPTTTVTDQYYSVAVTSNARIPTQLDQFLVTNPANPLVRLEPIDSVNRIAEQHFSTSTGTEPATANAPAVPVLFDTTNGPIPYHLGDVVLFVSRSTPIGGGNGTGIATVDPFTGAVETSVGNFAQFSGDIALRRSEGNVNASDFGNIFTLSNGLPNNVTDGTSGNLLLIDPGTAAVTSQGDDGIVTYRDDPGTAAVDDQAINVGVQFNAMTFNGNSGTNLIAIGNRTQVNWFGGLDQNIIYQFDAQSGAAVSAPGGNRNVGQSPTQVLLPGSAGTQIRELGQVTGVGGSNVTGLARLGGVYYVTTAAGSVYSLDPFFAATPIANLGEALGGLSVGPQSVEAGQFANTLFAIATDGTLYALDALGNPVTAFVDNQSSVETGITNVNGLAFSNLDRNLWHVTADRDTDPGHGIVNPFDDTRRPSTDGGSSLYFGSNGANNGTADNKYNFPGGAHGTILSNPISLKGYTAADQPTLYFSYFMATEPDDQDYLPATRTQPDAFRVYIAGDDGNWSLLGTNNSFQSSAQSDERDFGVGNGLCTFPAAATQPCVQELFQNSGSWRQARIPLNLFAGQENLRLRFEFTTAGSLSVGNINTTGTELRAVSADKLRDGQRITISNPATDFEVDLGPTLVVPTGAQIDAGGSFTITGTGSQNFTFSAAATGGNNIQVSATRSPAEIAADIVTRVNAFTFATNVQAVLTGGNRVNLYRASGAAVTVSAVVGMPATFVEGAAGVSGGSTPLVVNAGMSATQVAAVLEQALANVYAGGNLQSIKTYQDLVRLIGHSVTGAQFVPTGATAFGVESNLAGDGFGEADESSTTILGSGTLSTTAFPSRRGVDNNREGVYVDDIIIGFAERGEMVTGAQPDATNFRDNVELINANLPAATTQTLVGEYQLEIRRASEYWVNNLPGASPPRLVVRGIDTNDRATQSSTVMVPRGSDIADGTTWVLSDGVDTLTFEFDDLDLPVGDAQRGVTPGHVVVSYRPGMRDDEVAEALRNAINSTAVQAILDITANTSDGNDTGTASTSAYLNLYGNAVGNTSGTTLAAGSVGNVVETEDNSTIAAAQNIDLVTYWTRSFNANIGNATVNTSTTIPHATIAGTGDGTFDYYSFTVANAGDSAIFDIDGANFDTEIFLYTTAGVLLSSNDDSLTTEGAGGSSSGLESFLTHTFAAAGTYVIGVGRFNSVGSFGGITGLAPQTGNSYTLHVSLTGHSFSAVSVTAQTFNQFGDQNRQRDQGQVLIYSNLIRDPLQYGIVVDNGPRDRSDLAGSGGSPGVLPHPGAPINFDDLNTERLAPGAVLVNNVITGGGSGGIHISGDNTASLDAAVPFVRAVNNTIFGRRQGGDTGILVDQFASPTLLNNIVANLSTGIRIISDAGTNTSVVGGTIYQNNLTNATTPGAIGGGSFPIILAASDPLFVNAAADNFYLAAGSQAIDSALGSLQDRSDFNTRVKAPLGIAPSPILAPDYDLTGQLRFNDPTIATPSGQGSNVNIDRGAYDRNDFAGPFAELVVPRDNDSEGRDIDATQTVVQLTEGVYASFDIVLKDGLGSDTPVEGTGIDQSTVNVNNITVARDGILLRPNIDYIIGFQLGSNLLRITPLSGVWRSDAAYVITLAGIRDLAGNLLQPNQADSSTRFTILMPGVELDYGDLLDDAGHRFPTLFANNGARHTLYDNSTTIYLGRLVDQDNNNGLPTADATGDDANSMVSPPSNLTLDASASNGHLTWNSGPGTLTVGAVVDGDAFTISDRGYTVTFLFDSDGSTSVSATPPATPTIVIPFNTSDSAAQLAGKIVEGLRRSHVTDLTTGAGLSIHGSAAGNIVTITADNDEDSLRFGGDLRIPFNPLTASTPFDLLVSGSGTAAGGYLDAWFDWNADGDWSDPGEQVFRNRPVDIGLNNLSIVTPAAATAVPAGTQIAARFRLSLTGGLTPNNISVGGEVEDYIVTVYGGSPPVANPNGATDSYRVAEDGNLTTTDPLGTLTVGTNDNGVLANDTDADGDTLQVILLDTPDYAQSFTLNPNGTFNYVPLPNYNGIDTFTYLIRDNSAGALVSNTFGVATITVWEVNDPPVARDDQPTSTILITPEDPAGPAFYTFNSSDLVTNDWTPFGAAAPHPYSPPLGTVDTEQGQLLQVSGVGATNVSTTAATLQGGTITLNAVGGTLTYQPPLNFNDTSGPNTDIFDSFVYYVVDNGTTDGAADPQYNDNLQNPVGYRSATAYIRVTPVNDPPVNLINGNTDFSTAPALATNEDIPITLSTALGRTLTFNDLDIADVEGNDDMQVTLTATHGTLTTVSGSGATVTGDGTAAVTLRGTRLQLATAVDGLVFTPSLHYNSTINVADPALITIVTDDLGNFGAGGSLTDTDTLTITVNAVNDDPVNVVPSATQTLREDVVFTFSLLAGNAIQTSDVDVAEGTGKVTVTVSATHGNLTLATVANLDSVANNGTHVVTLTGLLADVNTALDGLTYVTDANYNGTDHVVIQTNDLGNFGLGGAKTDTDSVTLTIEPVNDGPINQYGGADLAGVPARTVDEDTDLFFTGTTQLGVFDLDAGEGTGEVHVVFDVTNGIVTLASTLGLTTVTGDGTNQLTVQGPLGALNAALNNLKFRGNQDFNGDARVVMTTNDLGNKGWSLPVGGVFDAPLFDVDTVTITVNAVNDDPINSVPGTQSVNEDIRLHFTGTNAVTVSDVDVAETPVNVNAGQGVLEVTLTAQNGTITLGNPAVVSVTGGASGTSTVTIRGTKANLDTAMDNMFFLGNLNYNSPAPGATPARLIVSTTDLGNTGQGGAKTDIDTIPITVNPVNDAPTQVVPGTQFVREDELLTFSPADVNTITVADVDVLETLPANGPTGSGVLEVLLTATNGTLTLGSLSGLTFVTGDGVSDATLRFRGVPTSVNTALNGLTFLGSPNYNGLASIVMTTSDLGNTGSGGTLTVTNTITVNIAAVNDPPVNFLQGNTDFPTYVASNPARFTIAEDTSLALSATNFNRVTIDDAADATTGSVRVTLTATHGTITVASTAGLTFSTGDGNNDPTMTFEGTIATINARMNGMIFRPDNNFDGLAQLTITTNDRGLTGADGPQSDTDTLNIVVTPVNDAPSNLVPGLQTVNEDTVLAFTTAGGNALQINDDAGNLPVTVTLTATNGTLTLGSTAGLISSSGNGTSTLNLRGPLTTVNTVLQTLSFLGNLNFNGQATITMVTNDEGNSGGVTPQTDTDTVTISINAVNDAPVNLFQGGTTFGTASTTDEDPVIFNAAGARRLTISDVDAGNGLMRMTLTANNGAITLANRTNLTFTVGDGTADPTMTFTGSIVDVNAALDNLSFRPNDYFSGTATLVIGTSDQGQTGLGGIQVDTDTVSITVTAVNDPPVNTVPGPQTLNEDGALVFSAANGNAISVADDAYDSLADSPADLVTENNPVSVTIATRTTGGSPQPIGTLTLGAVVPPGLVVTTGASLIHLVGLIPDINTALAGLTFTPPSNFNGSVNLSVTTDDLGNSPFTAVSNVTASSVAITVNAVNDAPVNTQPAGPIALAEDTTLSFAAGQWAVTDVDAGTGSIRVQLQSTLGTMTLAAGTLPALTFVVGDGTADSNMIFEGTIANINAALNTLSYTPTTNLSGDAVLTITTSDLGLSGQGGILTDIDSVTVSIAPVNDPPTVTVPTTQQTGEDTALTFSSGNANAISVVDDSGNGEILVQISSAQGSLALGTITGLGSVTGNNSPTINVRGTLAAINTALNGLAFTPAGNFTGDAVVTVAVNDQGNTGGGPGLQGTGTVTVTVLPRNDAPVNTVPGAQTTPEDITLTFGSAFGNQIAIDDIDAGSNAVRVQLAAINGVLTLSGVAGLNFTAGDGTDDGTMTFTGSMSAINTALNGLRFIPTTDFSGSGSVSITTNDQGNTGFPVTSLQDTDTVAITITSVNDAPRTAPLPRATSEDTALTVSVATLVQNDVPGPTNESGQTLTFSGVDPASANGGTVVVSGGNVIYTPPLNFPFASTVPLTDTFTYIVTDNGTTNGVAEPKSSRGTVTVTISPVNDAPVAVNDSYTMDEDTTLSRAAFNGVRANDTDAENSTLTVTRVAGPNASGSTNGGTLSLAADGSFTYSPPANYFGTVTFTYRVNDGTLNSGIATVTITVNNVNEPPVAVNDTATTTQGTPVNISVLGNDTDSDGTLDPTGIVIVTNPSHGTAVANANGTVTYTPSGTYQGPDSFQYTARDNAGGVSNAATVSLTVGAAPPAWQNQVNRFDINADSHVTPLDPLIIINDINANGSRLLQSPGTPNPPPYLDPDGNGRVEPRDVIVTIEFINNDGGGEGDEESTPVASANAAVMFVDQSTDLTGSAVVPEATLSSGASVPAAASTPARPALVIPVHDLTTAEGQRLVSEFRRQSASSGSLDSLVDDLADEWSDVCVASATDAALEALFQE